MFKITFTCEDRYLAKLMHALAGQVYNLEVVPVAGSNPELAPVNGSGSRIPNLKRADIVAAVGAVAMFAKVMRQQKLTEVNAKKTQEICRQLGLSDRSYSHLLRAAVTAGVLRKAGKDPNMATGFLWKLVGDK
jgi:hypothetical protein